MATILLIEDALDLAGMVVKELEANGYTAVHAADGLSGLRFFQDEPPDLIVLDWMLPDMDGLDVLRRIRQTSALPVLMLTARKEEIDRVIGLEVGADDYLTKPFGMRELIARIRALLRRIEHINAVVAADRAGTTQPISCGALQIDPDAHRAQLDGILLDLTHTEFNLLCFLARNPGRAFSRAYLQETIWGENYIPGERSVDNTIFRLRKKLGKLGEQIETLWGVGYRFNKPGEAK